MELEAAGGRSGAAGRARFDLLSREQEVALVANWIEGADRRARDRLVLAHLPLVARLARQYGRHNVSRDDLIQEGMIALLDALDRFDPSRGLRFSTYAAWWVRSAVRSFVLRNASIVTAGKTEAERSLYFKLPHVRARYAGSVPDSEVDARVASALGASLADVELAGRLLSGRDSALTVDFDGSGTWATREVADQRPTPEDAALASSSGRVRAAGLSAALDTLNPRERSIVLRHRLDEPGATLEELGAELGISKERVRQIEAGALRKLRAALRVRVAQADEYYGLA